MHYSLSFIALAEYAWKHWREASWVRCRVSEVKMRMNAEVLRPPNPPNSNLIFGKGNKLHRLNTSDLGTLSNAFFGVDLDGYCRKCRNMGHLITTSFLIFCS